MWAREGGGKGGTDGHILKEKGDGGPRDVDELDSTRVELELESLVPEKYASCYGASKK